MATSLQSLRRELMSDEPEYGKLCELGPAALPHLRALIDEGHAGLAARAAYLAAMIAGTGKRPKSAAAVQAAAGHERAAVRVAAAAGLRHLKRTAQSGATLKKLLRDKDPGVRRLAVKSSIAHATKNLAAQLTRKSKSDASPAVRQEAAKAVRRIAKEGNGK